MCKRCLISSHFHQISLITGYVLAKHKNKSHRWERIVVTLKKDFIDDSLDKIGRSLPLWTLIPKIEHTCVAPFTNTIFYHHHHHHLLHHHHHHHHHHRYGLSPDGGSRSRAPFKRFVPARQLEVGDLPYCSNLKSKLVGSTYYMWFAETRKHHKNVPFKLFKLCIFLSSSFNAGLCEMRWLSKKVKQFFPPPPPSSFQCSFFNALFFNALFSPLLFLACGLWDVSIYICVTLFVLLLSLCLCVSLQHIAVLYFLG